jgi:ABC-type polysaccharide/polyol phosphate export permease
LDLVAAQPAVDGGHLHHRVGTLLKAPTPVGTPSGLKNFAIFLLCGLLPWAYFANTVNGAMGVLTGNASLIRKVYFPREGLVVSHVASSLVTFLIEMLVLLAILVAIGNRFWPWIPVLVFVVAVQTVFCTGFALALSVLNVYFRDLQYLFSTMIMQAWFFLTPIVYPPSLVEAETNSTIAKIYSFNPMFRFTDTYRRLLYDNRAPTLVSVVYLVALAALALFIGLRIFNRYESRLAEEL